MCDVIVFFIEGIDLLVDVFFYMSVKEGIFCGVFCCLFRIFFIGEFGFEINVLCCYGKMMWEMFVGEIEKYGGIIYGIEIMYVLCVEKGYIIVG